VSALPPFQRFLDEHREIVWRYLVGTVGRVDADDVFQETFMAALRAYPRAHSKNLRSWVMTIAHNKAMDHFNARRPLPVAELPEQIAPEPPQRDEELWDRVRELPPKMRAAVTLRYVGDFSHKEIGHVLGCTEAAARRSLFEGLERLR
jgi:RNA polymerase sigma factor (sigma-70 family)